MGHSVYWYWYQILVSSVPDKLINLSVSMLNAFDAGCIKYTINTECCYAEFSFLVLDLIYLPLEQEVNRSNWAIPVGQSSL